MTHPQERDPLEPMLREAEADLADRLEEACAMRDPGRETTAELMRLEETLLDAARAAKQAVSVRRRRRTLGGVPDDHEHRERGKGGDGPDLGGDAQRATSRADEPGSVRDFVDEQRVEWRVWEVIPSRTPEGSHIGHQLGAFQSGWLAFEAVDTGQRRRLRDYPADWNKLSNDALESLLQRAEVARSPRRPPRQADESRS